MGLKDRILDFVARWGSPTMDHPAGGGMTGEKPDADDTETETDEAGESGQSSETSGSTSGP